MSRKLRVVSDEIRFQKSRSIFKERRVSKTGKTLQVKMVKSIGDERKLAVTYHDILLGLSFEQPLEKKPELLILDRFDLYDEHRDLLEKLKNTDCVALVDYKTQRIFCNFDDTCFLTLHEERLEVSL